MDLGDLIHNLDALSAMSGTEDNQELLMSLIERLLSGLKVGDFLTRI